MPPDADGGSRRTRLVRGHGPGGWRRVCAHELSATERGERHGDEDRNGGAKACAAAPGRSMPDRHRRPPFGCVMTATDDGALVGVRILPASASGPVVHA